MSRQRLFVRRAIAATDILPSFGIGSNWDFEEDFLRGPCPCPRGFPGWFPVVSVGYFPFS
jgi:hypothetical protein